MTRQRRQQIARNARGLCATCANSLDTKSKIRCSKCLERNRELQRAKRGFKAKVAGGRGRPSITVL